MKDYPAHLRNAIFKIKDILIGFEQGEDKIFDVEDVIKEAKKYGYNKKDVEEALAFMEKSKDILRDNNGLIARLRTKL